MTAPAVPGPLVHAPNFRDIAGIEVGGRRVVAGRIFRSGVFDLLDDHDRSVIRAIGLKTAIDLRADDERAARANALPPGVAQYHLPVTDVSAHPNTIMERLAAGDTDGLGAPMLIRGNRYFVEQQASRFGSVVRMLLDPGHHPAVVHCTAGKDRTGFAIACVLWALGADHEVVIADYLRTNEVMAARHERTLAEAIERGIDPRPLAEMLRVDRRYLDEARAAAIERHGSLDAFVRDGLEIDEATRARGREHLLG